MTPIQSVRVFAGFVVSQQMPGLRAPATLTLVHRTDTIECRFVFFVGPGPLPVPLTVIVANAGQSSLSGAADDPRGWQVSFQAEIEGDRVNGSYDQPHDRGGFALVEV